MKDCNAHYHRACLAFFGEPRERMGVGFSAVLHDLAISQGDACASLHWLESGAVQGFLRAVAVSVLQTSLDAERGFATVKKQDTSKLSHLATAGANVIHRRVLRQRNLAGTRLRRRRRAW